MSRAPQLRCAVALEHTHTLNWRLIPISEDGLKGGFEHPKCLLLSGIRTRFIAAASRKIATTNSRSRNSDLGGFGILGNHARPSTLKLVREIEMWLHADARRRDPPRYFPANSNGTAIHIGDRSRQGHCP
jgi:hypothetical protein